MAGVGKVGHGRAGWSAVQCGRGPAYRLRSAHENPDENEMEFHKLIWGVYTCYIAGVLRYHCHSALSEELPKGAYIAWMIRHCFTLANAVSFEAIVYETNRSSANEQFIRHDFPFPPDFTDHQGGWNRKRGRFDQPV